MKLTIISDTHGEHEKLVGLVGDVLIHCGDMFNMFNQDDEDFDRMDAWFGRQDFDLVLCTGGNHDFELQKRSCEAESPFQNAIYLEGKVHEHKGVRFFGAPWVPDLFGQAFFTTDDDLCEKWSDIPIGIDVVITHTPPAGILDISSSGLQLGCHHLLAAVERTSPAIHCFGHVHASSGVKKVGDTFFVNAALVNSQYELSRQPYDMFL